LNAAHRSSTNQSNEAMIVRAIIRQAGSPSSKSALKDKETFLMYPLCLANRTRVAVNTTVGTDVVWLILARMAKRPAGCIASKPLN
jgi:hypothetical protein